MVLILSNDGDLSCDLVQDWLDFYHYPYLRINSWEFLRKPISVSLVNGEFSFTMAGKKIEVLLKFWYIYVSKFEETFICKREIDALPPIIRFAVFILLTEPSRIPLFNLLAIELLMAE